MNWVDAAAISLVVLSGLFSMVRGFIREVLGVIAWAGAGLACLHYYGLVQPEIASLVSAKNLVTPVSIGVVFLVVLVVLSIASAWVGGLVRESSLSGLDRSLGLVFGFGRGALILCLAYIGLSVALAQPDWPAPVKQARLLPLVHNGAGALVTLLPPPYRPNVLPLPGNALPSAGSLMLQPVSGSALQTE